MSECVCVCVWGGAGWYIVRLASWWAAVHSVRKMLIFLILHKILFRSIESLLRVDSCPQTLFTVVTLFKYRRHFVMIICCVELTKSIVLFCGIYTTMQMFFVALFGDCGLGFSLLC